MAKRWSPQRRAAALAAHEKGNSPFQVAKSIGLSYSMVKEYFDALDKKPAKASTKKKTKAPKKKAAKKTTKPARKGAAKPADQPASKKERIDGLISSVNERLGANVVRRASETVTDYLLRRPTGIMSLDIGLGGGWPASSMCVLTGPDGAGKDYLINLTLAQQQRIYGNDFACLIYSTEFKFDKMFARDMADFQVRMTNEELKDRNLAREQKGLEPFTEEEMVRYKTQVGQVILVDGVVADDGLDVVLDAVHSNEFQVIIINSLGVLQTAAKEEKDTLRDHAIQANEAQLLSRFMPNLFMLLNRDDDRGNRNQTLVLATNQVRSNRNLPRTRPGIQLPEKAKYQSGSGSWALKHGKAIEVEIHKGTRFLDKEVKPPLTLGREVEWEVTKGKLGTHDGLRGHFDFWFDEGADLLIDLVNTGVNYGVIEKSGAWYSYQYNGEEIRGQGDRNMRAALSEHPEAIDAIRNECLCEAGIECLYR